MAPEAERGVGENRLAAGVAKPETSSERQLLGPLIVHPDLLNDVEEELADLDFVDPTLESMRQEIISWYSETEDLDREQLSNHLCTNGFATVIQQLTESGPSPISTVWYCRPDLQKTDVLEAWRARLEQYRRFSDRRGVGEAAWDALAGKLEDEARVQLLTTDQLLNHPNIKKPRGGR